MDIRDKIRKCLAVAAENSGATVAEAEAAMRQAEKLMRKHNIELGEVLTAEKVKAGVENFYYTPTYRPGKVYRELPPWVGIVAVGVAELYDCHVKGEQGGVRFFGYGPDLEAIKWTLDMILKVIYTEAMGNRSFCNGAAGRIQRRCREVVKEREQEVAAAAAAQGGGGGTAVMVLKRQLVAEEIGGVSYSKSKTRVRDAGEWVRGQKVADGMHLGRVVGSN